MKWFGYPNFWRLLWPTHWHNMDNPQSFCLQQSLVQIKFLIRVWRFLLGKLTNKSTLEVFSLRKAKISPCWFFLTRCDPYVIRVWIILITMTLLSSTFLPKGLIKVWLVQLCSRDMPFLCLEWSLYQTRDCKGRICSFVCKLKGKMIPHLL